MFQIKYNLYYLINILLIARNFKVYLIKCILKKFDIYKEIVFKMDEIQEQWTTKGLLYK